ncbi:MAG: hypothetical protein ACR2PX_18180 [Endozoicomonas sp.]|uniref:hypothetical protein n=1 Tax=Endozoicomonas sp. TaxID=1892382 RepID=UPI003D9ADC9A
MTFLKEADSLDRLPDDARVKVIKVVAAWPESQALNALDCLIAKAFPFTSNLLVCLNKAQKPFWDSMIGSILRYNTYSPDSIEQVFLSLASTSGSSDAFTPELLDSLMSQFNGFIPDNTAIRLLIYSTEENFQARFHLLKKHGVDIEASLNAPDSDGVPAFFNSKCTTVTLCKSLAEAGADFSLVDGNGDNFALYLRKLKTPRLLLFPEICILAEQIGLNLNHRDKNGFNYSALSPA